MAVSQNTSEVNMCDQINYVGAHVSCNNASSLGNYTEKENATCSNYYSLVNMTPVVPMTAVGHLIVKLDLYLVPVIIFVGLLGNTVSFIVFVSTSLRSLSSSVYLAALAVSDSGFLMCIFIMWSQNIQWNLHHQPVWCQLIVFLTYIFSFLSVWYVVSFTVERFIAVCFPFKRSTMCTVHKARIVVSVMAVAACVMYSFALWTTESVRICDTQVCQPRNASYELVQVLTNLDTVITLIIPMLVIIVLNVRISYKMISVRGEMKQILQSRNSAGSNQGMGAASRQVTKMLLVVSTVFLVLNLPGHAIRIHYFLMGLFTTFYPSQTYADCQTLFQYIYYLNFATNFFLYSMCGKNFRHALKQFCCRKTSMEVFKSRFGTEWRMTIKPARAASPVTKETYCNDEIEALQLRSGMGRVAELH